MSRFSIDATVLLVSILLLALQCSSQEVVTSTPAPRDEQAPTSAESSWNSTKENPLITAVTLKTANPFNVQSFQSEVLFKDGKFEGDWGGCSKEGVQSTKCVVLPEYQDRLSLVYSFDLDSSQEYSFTQPSIEVVTDGSKPTIENFDHDGSKLEFTLFFNCMRQRDTNNSTEILDLKIPILKNFDIETRFKKQCRSGPHPHVKIGMKNGTKESYITQSATTPVKVSSDVESSEFFIRVLSPAEAIVHDEAKLEVDGDGVGAKLRGILHKADVVRGSDVAWWLTYDCTKGTHANISVSVPIPPWDDLLVHVAKTCRGGAPEMLNIGTGAGKDDVVKMGIPTTAFNMTNLVGYTHGEVYSVGKDEERLRLYIQNTNAIGKGDLNLGKLVATLSDKKIVKVTAMFSDGKEVGIIPAGKGRMEVVRFVCLHEGKAWIVFSLPILGFPVVEFGIVKECAEPKAVTEFGLQSLWTVQGLEYLCFGLAAVAVVIYCLRTRGKTHFVDRIRGQRYEQVAAEAAAEGG